MRLLDLFCGAGGAAVGYHRAGFAEIVGVDIKPQPRYPFTFVLGDALEYVRAHGHEFDAIHASPPCQKFTTLRGMWNHKDDHPDLVEPTRLLLRPLGTPYAIENVPGSPLRRGALKLCGTMFGLTTADGRAELRRHRYFELSHPVALVPPCQHGGPTVGVYGDGNGRDYRRYPVAVIGVYGGHGRDRRRNAPKTIGVYGHASGSSAREFAQQFLTVERAQAMGIHWMTGDELSQAIPPAYSEFIGRQLLAVLASGRA
jgi:DNA (cytosine-5)-methyltransferase 1